MSAAIYPRKQREVAITDEISVGGGAGLLLIAGPCVLESRDLALYMAERLQQICQEMPVNFVFKTSFDKANRSSLTSFRGLGLEEGLRILEDVKTVVGCPVTTDVHEPWQCEPTSEVVDLLQIPAFLCRQTDLLIAAAQTAKPINVKKGQFMAPDDMDHVIDKIETYSNAGLLLTERGTCFGYHNLVFDPRSLAIMSGFGYPICADVTHSTQMPGGGIQSGGQREFAPLLARAAVAIGIDAIFAEVHHSPDTALSDSACQISLVTFTQMLEDILAIRRTLDATRRHPARQIENPQSQGEE